MPDAGQDQAGADRAGNDGRPHIDVVLRVADDGRLAGSAARGVDAHDLVLRHCEHAERIGLAQVILDGEREFREVLGEKGS